MFYRNFNPPSASHAEMWFLSTFGTPGNNIHEGGLEDDINTIPWNTFFNSTSRLDVLDYIIYQRPSVQDFLNLNNYPSAPQILREEPIKSQNLTDCYNQLDGLRAQNQLLIDHNQHLLTYQ
ncbi:hypothetical protein ACTFIR_008857 [Dictyostelium discoideum]